MVVILFFKKKVMHKFSVIFCFIIYYKIYYFANSFALLYILLLIELKLRSVTTSPLSHFVKMSVLTYPDDVLDALVAFVRDNSGIKSDGFTRFYEGNSAVQALRATAGGWKLGDAIKQCGGRIKTEPCTDPKDVKKNLFRVVYVENVEHVLCGGGSAVCVGGGNNLLVSDSSQFSSGGCSKEATDVIESQKCMIFLENIVGDAIYYNYVSDKMSKKFNTFSEEEKKYLNYLFYICVYKKTPVLDSVTCGISGEIYDYAKAYQLFHEQVDIVGNEERTISEIKIESLKKCKINITKEQAEAIELFVKTHRRSALYEYVEDDDDYEDDENAV